MRNHQGRAAVFALRGYVCKHRRLAACGVRPWCVTAVTSGPLACKQTTRIQQSTRFQYFNYKSMLETY